MVKFYWHVFKFFFLFPKVNDQNFHNSVKAKKNSSVKKMNRLGDIAKKESSFVANIEQGLDIKPSVWFGERCNITQKTATDRFKNGGFLHDEILDAVKALRHRDGTNPFKDEIDKDLKEANQ